MVDPVRVIDQQDHRAGRCRLDDKLKRGHRDAEEIGSHVIPDAEGGIERLALRIGQPAAKANDGKQELV